MRPAGKKLTRIGKPGPFATVDDAIEGLQNPNLATQFLARQRLLADGQASTATLTNRYRPKTRTIALALWVLDRLGGEARQKVVDELQSTSGRPRLGGAYLQRRGEEYRRRSCPWSTIPISRCAGRSCWPCAIGAGRHRCGPFQAGRGLRRHGSLLARGDQYRRRRPPEKNWPPPWPRPTGSHSTISNCCKLDPDATARFVTGALAKGNLDEAGRTRLLLRLSTIPSVQAAEIMLSAASMAEPPCHHVRQHWTHRGEICRGLASAGRPAELVSAIASCHGAGFASRGRRNGRQATFEAVRRHAVGRGTLHGPAGEIRPRLSLPRRGWAPTPAIASSETLLHDSDAELCTAAIRASSTCKLGDQ